MGPGVLSRTTHGACADDLSLCRCTTTTSRRTASKVSASRSIAPPQSKKSEPFTPPPKPQNTKHETPNLKPQALGVSVNTRSRRRLLHVCVILGSVRQSLVQIGLIDGPTQYLSSTTRFCSPEWSGRGSGTETGFREPVCEGARLNTKFHTPQPNPKTQNQNQDRADVAVERHRISGNQYVGLHV